MNECCETAKERLIKGGFEAGKAHVKALREHADGKHAAPVAEEPKATKR